MASAVKYLSNVTKSIKYATIDVFKELNPVLVEGVEENKDVAKVAYASIKGFKKTSVKATNSLASSQIGELAREAKKNLIEDLKSGKFYNKERENRIEDELASNEFGDDYSEFMTDDDSDLGFDDDSSKFLADTMDDVGEKASSAVNQVLVRTAEYQVEANRQSTTRMLAHHSALTATLHSDLAAVNANIAGVIKFNQEAMTTHIENSRMFYERQQQQMSEQISLLTEIRDIQKSVFMPEKSMSSSDRLSPSDILTSNGFINIGQYFKYIKQNIQDNDTGMGDYLKLFLDMGLGRTAVANPIGTIMKMGIESIIPNVLKSAMADFNETIAGSISTALLNVTKLRDSSNPVLSMIGNILGIDTTQKRTINTGDYNKGAVSWTGKDHKALTEVIPTLLSKIHSAVSGQNEVRYDYEEGRFSTYDKIKEDFENLQNRFVMSANDSIMPYLQDQINKVDFGGDKERTKEFLDHLDQILKYNFKNVSKFNPKDKSIKASTYGLTGDHAEYDLELIRSMYEKIPKNKQLKNQQDLIEAIQSMNRTMTTLQESGDSKYNVLFNGSMGPDFGSKEAKKLEEKQSKTSPIASGFNKLDITNNILLDIRNYLFSNKRKNGDNRVLDKTLEDFVISTDEAIDDKEEDDTIRSSLGFGSYGTADGKTMRIGEEVNLEDKKEQSKLIKNIKEATTATGKIKALFKGGVSSLFSKPAEFMSGIMHKVDNRLYNLLFSEDEDVDGSILDKIKDGLSDWFNKLKDMAKDKFEGIKDAIGESGIKGKFSSIMKNLFGFDFTTWEEEFKEALFGDKDTSLVSGLKDLFVKGFREVADKFKKFFGIGQKDKEKTEDKRVNQTIADILKSKGTNKGSGLGKTAEGETTASEGTKEVKKTGLVAVSKGEIIIPPDVNPAKAKKRKEQEDKIIEKYKAIFGDEDIMGSYAEGGVVGEEEEVPKTNEEIYAFLKNKIREGWSTSKVKKWVDEHLSDPEAREELYNKAREQVRTYTKEKASNMTKKVIGFGNSMVDEAKKIGQEAMENEAVSSLIGKITNAFSNNKNMPGEGRAAVADVMKNFREYLPRIAAGGVAGAGLSLIFGLAGGPILGAALGAGVGILTKSEKLKTWLFGEQVTDENGKTTRDGSGLISKNIVDKAQKYFPGIAKGSIVGAITSILPFVPGGPIAGILVGSATGFALSTDKVKNALFGEDGKLTKAKDVLKKKLPRMGLGAAAGAVVGGIAGPFGLVTNMMLGAGIGLISDTEKFKDIVFGVKGFDGKRAGGLVGFIKEAFEIPIEGVKNLFKDIKDWFSEHILSPLKDGIKPIIRQFQNIGDWIKEAIKGAFRDHIAKPIGKVISDRIVKPIEKAVGGFIRKVIINPAKFLLSLPFRAIGSVGRSLEKRQLKKTGAAGGTIYERLSKRQKLDEGRTNKKYTNTEAQKVDSWVFSLSNEQLQEFYTASNVAREAGRGKQGQRRRENEVLKYAKSILNKADLNRNLNNAVWRNWITAKDAEEIKKEVLSGKYTKSVDFIKNNGAFEEAYKDMACKQIKDTALQIKKARERLLETNIAVNEIKRDHDIDLGSRGVNRVLEEAIKERKLDQPTPEKSEEQKEEEKNPNFIPNILKDNHKETMKVLEKIAGSLESIEKWNKTRTEEDFDHFEEKKDNIVNRVKDKKLDKTIAKDEELLEKEKDTENYQGYTPNFTTDIEEKKAAKKEARQLRRAKIRERWDNFRDSDPIERVKNIFAGTLDSLKNQQTTTPGITDVVSAAQNGNYADAMKMVNSKGVTPGVMRRIARNVVNKIRRTSKSHTVMTENGPILMRKNSKGVDIPDTRSGDTKETLEARDEDRSIRRGILSKLSGIGDGFKKFFGIFGGDDEDEEGGPFKRLFKNIGKFILPVLGVVGGLAGLGLARKIANKTIKVQQKDAQGNKLYDENGNPIMTETTIGELIKNKVKDVWLGEDGTGNTSGVWYHIKTFAKDQVLPLIKSGFDLVVDKLPNLIEKLVSALIQNAPVIFGAIITGIAKGAVSLFKKALSKLPLIGRFFEDKEDRQVNKESKSSEEIESSGGTVTLTTGSTITGAKSGNSSDAVSNIITTASTKGTTTTNTSSSKKVTEQQASSTVQTVASTIDTSTYSSSARATNSGTATSTTRKKSKSSEAATGEPGNEREIRRSLAFRNACPSVQKKALPTFKKLWNTQVLDNGMTLAELCNDDQYVVAEIQDGVGNVTQVTGATLLLYPDIAAQLLGVDIKLTDDERNENSQYVRDAVDPNPANWAAVKVVASGGRYGKTTLTKGIRLVEGVGKSAKFIGDKVGGFISKGPGVFKLLGRGLQITGRATNAYTRFAAIPMRVMESGRRVVEDFSTARRAGATIREASSAAVEGFRGRNTARIEKVRTAANAKLDAIGKSKGRLGKKLTETTKKVTNKGFDAAQKVNNITSADVKQATDKMKGGFDALKKKGGKVGKAAGALGKLGEKAKTVLTNLKTLLAKFFSQNKVLKQFSKVIKCAKGATQAGEDLIVNSLKKFSSELLQKVAEGLARKGAKIIAKVAAKLASYIGTAGIVTVAFLIIDFIRGMTKADAILGVEKPTVAERLIAGLVNAFAETFFITLVVDTRWIVQHLINLLEKLGVDFSKLRARQQEAEENCDQYNRIHGTNYTVEEYLMSDHLGTKIKSALKRAFSIKKKGDTTGEGSADISNEEQELTRKEKRENRKAERQSSREERRAKRQARRANRGADSNEDSLVTDIATSDTQIYDESGNVVGSGIDEDGYIENMYISQGDSTEDLSTTQRIASTQTNTDLEETTSVTGVVDQYNKSNGTNYTEEEFTSDAANDATTGNRGIISRKNKRLMNQARADINASIPKMINLLKYRLASYFGLKPSDLNKTTNIGEQTYRNSSPSVFFGNLNSMWRMANLGIGTRFMTLPKAIRLASKSMSHFLAVSFGLADPDERTISLEDATTDAYLNRRAKTIQESSVFGALLAGNSVTGSNSADESTQTAALDENTTTTKKKNGLLSKVKNFISKIFGGGSGSGLNARPDEYGDIPDQDRSNAETFISQRYSRYANDSFTVKGDETRETVADAGCAPAAATMAINNLGSVEPLDMNTAMKDALKFKKPNGGVTADYFIDEFDKHGLQAAYVAGNSSDKKDIITSQLKRGNPIILMGQDESNGSKTISPFGPKTHYVVATGMSSDGKYMYINDPEAKNPKIPYSVNKVLRGTILGVAPLAKTKKITGAANNKARKILSQFGGTGKYGPDTVQYKVWNGLRAAGYSEAATAAAMGNIEHESGFDTSAIEKGSGKGFGLVQWTGGRRTAYEKYAKSLGKPVSDVATQINYLLQELDAGSGQWVKKCSSRYGFGSLTRADWANASTVNDIETATKAFMACFERPTYDSSKNHIDRRIDSAYKYYQEFTGTQIDPSLLSSSSGTTGTESESAENSVFQNILDLFTQLGSAYGITSANSLTSGSSGSDESAMATGEVRGAVVNDSKKAEQQKQLVREMMGIQNTLPYSQTKRNVEKDKSGDCSSTVQWAYKKVIGVDPGGWTGAQYDDSDTYTVTTSLNDPSKLQLGDLLLRKGHVEMYAGLDESGNHIMIGHGGSEHTLPDGTTTKKGPFIRKLAETPPYNNVRRWVGFKPGGFGSGLTDTVSDRSSTVMGSRNNSIYTRKWTIGGSGSGINNTANQTSDYQVTTTIPSTSAGKGSTTMVPASSRTSSGETMDKLIQVVIGLLSQVVSNTSAIKDISTLLVKLLDLKSSSNNVSGLTDDEKTYFSSELGIMKALIAQSYESNSQSEDENIATLIRNVEAIAQL